MVNSGETLCFTCGLEVGDPPRLNRLDTGEICSTCQDRLLDSLPALLPGQDPETIEEAEVVCFDEGDADFEEDESEALADTASSKPFREGPERA